MSSQRAVPEKKPQAADSRYVTVLSDSTNYSDITFKDAAKGLLPRSSKNYEVGIDNFTLKLSSFSLLDPVQSVPVANAAGDYGNAKKGVVFEFLRCNVHNTNVAHVPNLQIAYPFNYYIAGNNTEGLQRRDYQVRSDEATLYHTVSELYQAVKNACEAVSNTYVAPYSAANADLRKVEAHINTAGIITIEAPLYFWHWYMIHIPNKQYQHLFLGDLFDPRKEQRLIIINADTTELVPLAHPAVIFAANYTTAAIVPQAVQNAALFTVAAGANQPAPVEAFVRHGFKFRGSIFGFDRRIAVEIGSSLPLTQSALIEDNNESSDFILGRFMYQTSLKHSMNDSSADGITVNTMNNNVIEFMNGTRRVMYHRLHPQEKIATMRIRLFARVRTYDEATNDYQLTNIRLPTVFGDWWHIRLHFHEITDTSISIEKKGPVY